MIFCQGDLSYFTISFRREDEMPILLNNLLLVVWIAGWSALNYFMISSVISKLITLGFTFSGKVLTIGVWVIFAGVIGIFVASHICSTTKNIIYIATHKK